MQIIPAIDLRDGKCVRLRQGDYADETVFSDDPAEMACRWAREGAARLHLVDLDGAKAGRPVNVDAVRAIVKAAGVPCQLGGGVRDEATMRQMFDDVGIERVIVGTQALKQPAWFREMAEKFPQRLVLGIDARDSMVATEGWLDVSQTSALELARGYADLPIAAIVYTNIANDGMMSRSRSCERSTILCPAQRSGSAGHRVGRCDDGSRRAKPGSRPPRAIRISPARSSAAPSMKAR